MSWISALSPWQWGLLAAVPVGIILLYFLKLRREPVEVPSTYLWSRTIEDLHVNSLLQRLRRSLLLLLQLLAVTLAAIALLRPGVRGETTGQNRMVFLLDTSASMQATDGEDAESRFEQARKQIEQRIDTMGDDDTAMLVTFSDRAETMQAFTSDRRRLRDALARVNVTNHPTDILGALKAADGLANPRRTSEAGNLNDVQVADPMPADLLIYSDGCFENVEEFNLGNLKPEYIAVGSGDVNNLAITAFSAERNVENPAEVQAFATVANLGTQAAEATATLSLDGEFLDAAAVQLEPGDQTGLSFLIENEDAATLTLSLDADDQLAIDNVAYAGLAPLRTVSVLVVADGNTPLELGLSTPKAEKICLAEFAPPEFLDSEQYSQRAAAGSDDLIIYDRCTPASMPNTNTFFIGALPPAIADQSDQSDQSDQADQTDQADRSDRAGWIWAGEASSPVLIDVDRSHPLMQYLELYSLLIFRGRPLEGPAGATELVVADAGPMLVLAPREGYQDLVLGFDLVSRADDGATVVNTNWYTERSWPVFVLNVLRYLAGAAEAAGAPSYRPGETVNLRLESSLDTVQVQRVDGSPIELAAGPRGIVEVVDTAQPGNYRVTGSGRLVDLFAINLFDRNESDIAAAESVELGYESVAASERGLEQRKEYWRWALIGMLGLLATEWWLYTRRLG